MEVLIYIGLFSFVGTALFSFAWDVITLAEKGRANRVITEESRLMTERMKFLVRSATGVDEEQSVWNDPEGRLVLRFMGTSDTVVLERKNDVILLQRNSEEPIALHSSDVVATALSFERPVADGAPVSYVTFRSTLASGAGLPSEYTVHFTLATGAFLRNFGL